MGSTGGIGRGDGIGTGVGLGSTGIIIDPGGNITGVVFPGHITIGGGNSGTTIVSMIGAVAGNFVLVLK